MTHVGLKALGISISLLGMISAPGFAAETAKEPSAEARQRMASAHQKMADCLKSARPLSECRDEMKASCQEMGEMCAMKGRRQGMRRSTESDKQGVE